MLFNSSLIVQKLFFILNWYGILCYTINSHLHPKILDLNTLKPQVALLQSLACSISSKLSMFKICIYVIGNRSFSTRFPCWCCFDWMFWYFPFLLLTFFWFRKLYIELWFLLLPQAHVTLLKLFVAWWVIFSLYYDLFGFLLFICSYVARPRKTWFPVKVYFFTYSLILSGSNEILHNNNTCLKAFLLNSLKTIKSLSKNHVKFLSFDYLATVAHRSLFECLTSRVRMLKLQTCSSRPFFLCFSNCDCHAMKHTFCPRWPTSNVPGHWTVP